MGRLTGTCYTYNHMIIGITSIPYMLRDTYDMKIK